MLKGVVFHDTALGHAVRANWSCPVLASATFGEGSFDKGIFLSVPFDAILGRSSGFSPPIRYVPVLRDVGQRLSRAYLL